MLQIVATVAIIAALAALGHEARGLMADRDSREGTAALLLVGAGCLLALGVFGALAANWAAISVAVGGTAALSCGFVPVRRRTAIATPQAAADANVVTLRQVA